MADESTTILVELDLDKKSIKLVEKETEKDLAGAGDKAGKSLAKGIGDGVESGSGFVKASLGSLTSVFAAAAASIGAAFTIREAIESAQRQDDAINKLNASLQRIGEFSQQTSKDLQDYASSLQNVTKFGDEAVLEQLAFAQSLGASADQSKEIVRVAADLASALGIDLSSATRNITKTLGGLKGELGEVIPELGNLTKEQLQSGAAIDILSKKFSGFAQKDAASFSGALAGLSNSFGDLLEELGFFITRSDLSVGVFGALKEAAQGAGAAIRDFRLQFQQTTSSEAEERINQAKAQIIDLEQTILKANKSLREGVIRPERLALQIESARNEIERLNAEIETLGVKREELAVKETQAEAANTKLNESVKQQTGLLALNNEQLTQRLGNIGLTQSQQLEQKFQQENEVLKASFDQKLITEQEFNERKLELTRAFNEQNAAIETAEKDRKLNELFATEEGISDIVSNLPQAFNEAARQIKITSLDIAKSSLDILSRGVGGAFQNIGRALASGQNAFDAFKDALKGVLGDIASATGDLFIKQGIGFLFTNPALGGGLIAAGAGLKILSGFLGASSSTTGGTSGGGVGSVQSGDFQTTGLATSEDRVEQGPTINLNVEGNIFDSNETGTRLVTLINDAFDRDGAVVNRSFA